MANHQTNVLDGAMVKDSRGRRYVAVHPGYAAPSPAAYRRGLTWRIVVCVLTAVALVLNVVGQLVPNYSQVRDSGLTTYQSAWQSWLAGSWSSAYYDGTVMSGFMCAVAALFLFISLVLSAVLASTWSRLEQERLRDRADSELAMAEVGHPRQEYGDRDDADGGFPYTNLRVTNYGLVAKVPYEVAEMKRRRYDRDMCAATLSMLIIGAIMDLTSVAMMGAEIDGARYSGNCQMSVADPFGSYTFGPCTTHIHAGVPIMTVSTAAALAAFILVAIPQATKAPLCGSLRPAPCALMVVDDAAAAEITAELRWYTAWNAEMLANTTSGVREAMPGPAVDEQSKNVAAEMTAVATGGGLSSTSAGVSPASAPYGYSSAQYYAAPPQLFHLDRDAGDDGAASVASGTVLNPISPTAAARGGYRPPAAH